ncbi:MAG: glycosyltransferase family 1 protein, partial [Flavobacteriales bacterium]|nr:glycosyltransferase family 1 protein [Flavobacteriales bacterium]
FARHFRSRFPEYARKSSKLCTVSEFSRGDIARTYHIDEASISIIPNAPDASFKPLAFEKREASRTRFASGNKYHVFVGSIHPRKNIHGMLKAHTEYRLLGGKSDLVIVGAAMWNYAEFDTENVHWVGRLNDNELVSAVAGADALLYLPFFEGFGVPVVEAMACGVPVIASNTTSIPEVCGGAAAALVSPTDAKGAAEALLRLNEDEVWCEQKSKQGIKRAAEFSWERSAQLFSNALDEMLSEA